MVRKRGATQSDVYLAHKARFNRKRRKINLDFDQLYALLASGVSLSKIAQLGGVTKKRVNVVYELYFRIFFRMGALERAKQVEELKRTKVADRVAKAIAADPVLKAIRASAARAKPKRIVKPVLLKRGDDPVKRYRHKAVLVDGKAEVVHYIQSARRGRGRTISYASTTLYRTRLQRDGRSIFVVDVPRFRRRVIRSKNLSLLRTFFAEGQKRVTIYIPLDSRPQNPRHDFVADEDNWT